MHATTGIGEGQHYFDVTGIVTSTSLQKKRTARMLSCAASLLQGTGSKSRALRLHSNRIGPL